MRSTILIIYLSLVILAILPPTIQLQMFAEPKFWFEAWRDTVKPDAKHPMYPPKPWKPRPTIEERTEPTSMPKVLPRKGGGGVAGARGGSIGRVSSSAGHFSSGGRISSSSAGHTGSKVAAAGAGGLAGGAGGAMLGPLAGGGSGNTTANDAASGPESKGYKMCLGFLVWAVGVGAIV
ncbi:hypothetical protein HYFRA_00011356 [Hymenoscyphus fraxineus]|uniref:Uncharacterized protein n=1 Tax=Hymenoscyphus fraxineus TaxID=746836 RepID=A0A9N9PV96_9HELO|nr:hypothetical protein HYFRA_00011356 [Hymenoscyphus fraxineus]